MEVIIGAAMLCICFYGLEKQLARIADALFANASATADSPKGVTSESTGK